MFGLSMGEMMVAAIVALIVIGPKELPIVFRKVGQMVGKAKGMAREFSSAMDQAADQAGMKDAMDSVNSIQDTVRTVSDPTTKWKDFVPGSETAKLAEDRAAQAKKLHDAMADKAQARLDAVQAANAAAEVAETPVVAPKKPTKAKKPAAKKATTAKKPAAKKAASKKPTAKKAAAKSAAKPKDAPKD